MARYRSDWENVTVIASLCVICLCLGVNNALLHRKNVKWQKKFDNGVELLEEQVRLAMENVRQTGVDNETR